MHNYLQQMKTHNVSRDIVTYHEIMEALVHFNKVNDLSSLMNQIVNEEKLNPTLSTYHFMLQATAKTGDLAMVNSVLEEMKKRELNMDKTAYNYYVETLVQAGDHTQVIETLLFICVGMELF